ncbi:MAG TPA: UDP-N-acetylmuramoyl-L-alanine--D-glutamate ligase [Ignavibacteriaceae bacterium]|jgi:UDP-N-acetylmuramoylalanine--D-glutamate ligase|nr:MAG: UDP-N-acetylmuramoylalanine--D-glutamate ligase [Ignavibacteria bacterium ADurb.Bin266]OQY70401.1 MAG: UDP-N-acetylmuramoyl-L-alanine--D-glutamate ligase [Ignavibacteriales bacterium UTCHB2]HQF41998.1 UDP-N-acetylmuramoyl-L-alanine--D-glutamate ligase [Ignavibacteriaceae bacterium]HQI39639.1 UDP-N-acetylmuramoyl-L-alanine--D-glutamate ligase [Ignavibacteriaceae bacterium]
MLDIRNKKITIIGAVRSGIGAARLAKQHGAIPFVSDSGSEEKLKSSIDILRNEKIDFEIGKHSEKVFNCDLMIVSPGVPSDSEVIKNAKTKNLKIISELEFASSFCKGNIIGITGTNGKTTTTSLCGYLFNECGKKTYTAGNIGLAFSEIANTVKENEFVSLEISSFQLDLIESFKPKVAMILNITPDHLNRYENSVEKYAHSKLRIFENQNEKDFLILSKDSDLLNQYFKKAKSNIFFFSTNKKVNNGCYLENDEVRFVKNDITEFSCKISDINIKGEHNIQNAMAVIIAAKIFDLDNEKILEALKLFKGVEHRLELVREISGIKFINDSKATNVDSVEVALKSFDDPIFLILGGQDKGNDYSVIEDLVIRKVKKIYAIGSSAEKVFNYFHRKVKTEIKKDFNDVINAALSEARKGDVVLLSPACASFDMFDNYEHRGKVFKEIVNSK